MELIFLFAIEEEKGLVLSNGAADRAAKMVQVELFRRGGKVALGIKRGVAQKFEERPVKIIGPGFRGDHHRGSCAGTVFGGVGVGQYLEFLNVVDRGEDADTARSQFVIVDAVQQPVCAVGSGATDESEKDPRAATSLLAAEVKKLLGLVSAVAPEVSVAS